MRASCFLFTFAAVAVLGPAAHADPIKFVVNDHGDTVEVIATGVVLAPGAITTIRERLEIPLSVDAGTGRHELRVNDPTIKQIEIHGRPRMLSIKLAHERPVVVALAPLVRATQDGAEVRITIPRTLAAATAPLATPVVTAPAAPPAAPPTTESTAPGVAAPVTTVATVAPVAPVDTSGRGSRPAAVPKKTEAPAGRGSASLIGAPGLAALGGVALLLAGFLHRRRKHAAPVSSIDILAQRSIGGKAKIVWLSAGGREMVVAVTSQHVRMLGQWRRPGDASVGGEPPTLARATAMQTGRLPTLPGPLSTETATPRDAGLAISPAVSGILRLRERASTVQPVPAPDDSLDDDVSWARELLAATGGRR